MKEVMQYCDDVRTGKIPAGIHLRNAVTRFEKDLKNNNWTFEEKKFQKVVKFFAKLKHFTDVHARKPFKLEPWQLFIVANLYGFHNKDGRRRFQTAYIEVARKNGKTAFMAGLSLYHLIDDNEGHPEILFAANSKDQAKIGFNMCKGFSDEFERKVDDDHKRLRRHHSDINFMNQVNGDPSKYRDRYPVGVIKNLAADDRKLDGYNCSLGIVDEYHSAKNSKVRDVLRSSMAMRLNPLLVTITTAGFDKTSVCYELRTLCTEIISGAKEDDSFFAVIFSMDEGDDWKNPDLWVKANPNLGVTVYPDFIEKQIQQAINSPATDEIGVKTKNLNIWCDSSSTWIPDDHIIEATQKLNIEDFRGQECYVGVDLASNTDLTVVAYMFERDDKYYFFYDYYIPIETISRSVKKIYADRELYKQWVKAKFLKTTPGNVTDYDYITRDMLKVNEICPIELVYYDKYNATAWAIQCTDAGLNLDPFSQVIANFNIPTREFERLMLSGRVVLDDNPITRACLRNVELRKDFNGNVKPNKDSAKKKIDGVIAMLQCLAARFDLEKEMKGIQIY